MKKRLFLANVFLLFSLFILGCAPDNIESSSAVNSLSDNSQSSFESNLSIEEQTSSILSNINSTSSSFESNLSSNSSESSNNVSSDAQNSSGASISSSNEVLSSMSSSANTSSNVTISSIISSEENHEYDAIKGNYKTGYKCFFNGNYQCKISDDGILYCSSGSYNPDAVVDFYDEIGLLIKDANDETHYYIETNKNNVLKRYHIYSHNDFIVYFDEDDPDKTAVYFKNDIGINMPDDNLEITYSLLVKDYSDNTSKTTIGQYINVTLNNSTTYKMFIDFVNYKVDFSSELVKNSASVLAVDDVVTINSFSSSTNVKVTALANKINGYRFTGVKLHYDGYQGTYSGIDGEMNLDGLGNVTFKSENGTYVIKENEITISFETKVYILNIDEKTYEEKAQPQLSIFANSTFSGRFYEEWDECYNDLVMTFDNSESISGKLQMGIAFYWDFTGEFDLNTYTLTITVVKTSTGASYLGKTIKLLLEGNTLKILNDFGGNVYKFANAILTSATFTPIN